LTSNSDDKKGLQTKEKAAAEQGFEIITTLTNKLSAYSGFNVYCAINMLVGTVEKSQLVQELAPFSEDRIHS
jgi:hypothetical protein